MDPRRPQNQGSGSGARQAVNNNNSNGSKSNYGFNVQGSPRQSRWDGRSAPRCELPTADKPPEHEPQVSTAPNFSYTFVAVSASTPSQAALVPLPSSTHDAPLPLSTKISTPTITVTEATFAFQLPRESPGRRARPHASDYMEPIELEDVVPNSSCPQAKLQIAWNKSAASSNGQKDTNSRGNGSRTEGRLWRPYDYSKATTRHFVPARETSSPSSPNGAATNVNYYSSPALNKYTTSMRHPSHIFQPPQEPRGPSQSRTFNHPASVRSEPSRLLSPRCRPINGDKFIDPHNPPMFKEPQPRSPTGRFSSGHSESFDDYKPSYPRLRDIPGSAKDRMDEGKGERIGERKGERKNERTDERTDERKDERKDDDWAMGGWDKEDPWEGSDKKKAEEKSKWDQSVQKGKERSESVRLKVTTDNVEPSPKNMVHKVASTITLRTDKKQEDWRMDGWEEEDPWEALIRKKAKNSEAVELQASQPANMNAVVNSSSDPRKDWTAPRPILASRSDNVRSGPRINPNYATSHRSKSLTPTNTSHSPPRPSHLSPFSSPQESPKLPELTLPPVEVKATTSSSEDEIPLAKISLGRSDKDTSTNAFVKSSSMMPKVGSVWSTRSELILAADRGAIAAGYEMRLAARHRDRKFVLACVRTGIDALSESSCPARLDIRPVDLSAPDGQWKVISRVTEHSHQPTRIMRKGPVTEEDLSREFKKSRAEKARDVTARKKRQASGASKKSGRDVRRRISASASHSTDAETSPDERASQHNHAQSLVTPLPDSFKPNSPSLSVEELRAIFFSLRPGLEVLAEPLYRHGVCDWNSLIAFFMMPKALMEHVEVPYLQQKLMAEEARKWREMMGIASRERD